MKKFRNKGVPDYLVGKSDTDIIEEIHAAFDTEVNRLLEQANIKTEVPKIEDKLCDKASLLERLGFKNATPVRKVHEIGKEARKKEMENEAKNKLIKVIQYFQMKYPNHKFITEESVKNICKKYFLIYGDVDKYIGDVPEKNIQDMLNFKIDEVDKCYYMLSRWSDRRSYFSYDDYISERNRKEEKKKKLREIEEGESIDSYMQWRFLSSFGSINDIGSINESIQECPFVIAAPSKDFDTKGMELDGFELKEKIEIPDPVVLQPVFHNGERYFLVVTAWGLEASDEDVVNQKMN